jgi:hypothetical protein
MIHTFSYDNFNNLEEVVGLRMARVLRLINFHVFFCDQQTLTGVRTNFLQEAKEEG